MITNYNKFDNIEERLTLNDRYEYECLLITIDKREDLSKVSDIIINFCNKYEIQQYNIGEFFQHIQKPSNYIGPIYIRLTSNSYDDKLQLNWGTMEKFTDNQRDNNYKYERIFTLQDLEDGILDGIRLYGKSMTKPSYKPRKRMLENRNYTISDKENVQELLKKKLSYSKYNPIIVRIKDIKDRKKFFDTINWYGIFPGYLRRTYKIGCDYIIILKELTNSTIAPFRVVFTDDYDYYDSGDFMEDNPTTYPKLLTPDELDNILEELLGISDTKSMYSPKKIVQTTDVVDEGISYWTYRFKTREEFEKEYGDNWQSRIQEVNLDDEVSVGWASPTMDHLLGQPCEIENIDLSKNLRYEYPTDRISRGYWIITNEMLIKNKQLEPSYTPRRIDRTLESLDTDYDHIIIKIESLSEFRKAQRELLNQNYTWITNSRRVQDSAKDEDYPLYIFVNGDNVRFHRRKFFYECTSLLDEGSLQRTILRRQESSEKDKICPKVYTIHDMSSVDRLFKYVVEPNYRPRRIDRTLEGFTDKQDEEVNVLIQSHEHNEKLQKELFRLGYSWYENDKTVRDMEIGNVLTFYPDGKDIVWSNNVEEHNKFITSGWRKTSKIYPSIQVCEPSYKPKKIERTLESYKGYPYDSIIIQINNKEDADIVYNYLNKYENCSIAIGAIKDKLDRSGLPVYIRLNLGHNDDEKEWHTTHGSIQFLLDNSESNGLSYEKIFTVKDLEKGIIDNLLRYSKVIINPSYKPRKVDRTLESTINYPYRIKTEKELIDEYGLGWRRIITKEIGWSERMYDLLGTIVSKLDIKVTMENLDDWIVIEDQYEIEWTFTNRFLTENELSKPTYKPKKIVKTLEGKTWYPYRFKTEEEMIKAFGDDWREFAFEGTGWSDIDEDNGWSEMDKYLGQDFPYTEDQLTSKEIHERPIYTRYEGWAIHWDMLTPNEKIIKVPSYTPRKIDRTLESVENNQYRFKTRQEFIAEFGNNYKTETGWGKFGDMDYLFGKKLSDFTDKNVDVELGGLLIPRKDNPSASFYISTDWLTTEPLKPHYSPKKFDRTLEATDFENTLIKKIQSVLTKDLLVSEWAKKLESGKHHPHAGHCYAASEALFHLLGGKEKGYKVMRGKGLNNETHWWIVDKDGKILDPTSEQFYFVGLKPPYENGKGTGYLTKNPSKRAKEIISRIQNI